MTETKEGHCSKFGLFWGIVLCFSLLFLYDSLAKKKKEKKTNRKKRGQKVKSSTVQGWEPWCFLLNPHSCFEPQRWYWACSSSLSEFSQFLRSLLSGPLLLYPSLAGLGESNLGTHKSWLSSSTLTEGMNVGLLMQIFSLRPLLEVFLSSVELLFFMRSLKAIDI